MICGKAHAIKPKLGFVFSCLDVNMGRFPVFVAEEEKPVWANMQDGWHEINYTPPFSTLECSVNVLLC